MLPRVRIALIVALTFAATVASFGQHSPEPTNSPARRPRASQSSQTTVELPGSPVEISEGRKLFEVHCATCHGPNGEGAKGPTLAQPTLPRASDDASLLRIIRSGIDGTEMPRARMERHEVALVAGYVKWLGSKPPEQVPGDVEKGAEIFKTKGVCLQCHTVAGEGGVFGPDLTEIGRRRSAAFLRRALLQPTEDVPQSYSAFRSDISLPQNFLYVRVVPKPGGEEIAGIRINEDTFSIQLRNVDGKFYSFFKSEVAALHKDFGYSPMPSYAEALTPDEVDDLVAYLVSLRGDQ